jgi:hypothetical protein
MRFVEPNCQPQRQDAHSRLCWIVVAVFCFSAITSVISFAQSGRRQSSPRAESALPNAAPAGPEQKKQLRLTFIVATAVSDNSEQTNPYAGSAQVLRLDYHARGGCLLELRDKLRAKVVEDEDLARWEARETAQTDDQAWVIWMELKFDQSSLLGTTPFRLRYLLFEPGTGKLVSSGYGKPIRQTWGVPPPRHVSPEDQARQAGRDVAEQVISELRKRAMN